MYRKSVYELPYRLVRAYPRIEKAARASIITAQDMQAVDAKVAN